MLYMYLVLVLISPGTDLDMGGSEPSSPRKEVLVSKELLRRSMSPAETIAALGADCMSDAEMVEMSEYKAIYFAGLQVGAYLVNHPCLVCSMYVVYCTV